MPRKSNRRSGMAMCKICAHPQRARLDFLCAQGAPIFPIARPFGVSKDSLYRHYKKHVSDEFKKSIVLGPFRDEAHLRRLCAESGTSVLDNLRTVYSGVASRWLVAYEAGADEKLALLTARLHQNLE